MTSPAFVRKALSKESSLINVLHWPNHSVRLILFKHSLSYFFSRPEALLKEVYRYVHSQRLTLIPLTSAGVSGSSVLHYILQSLYSFWVGSTFHSFARWSICRTPFSRPTLSLHLAIADCLVPCVRGSRDDQACTTGTTNLPFQDKSLLPELFNPSPPGFLTDFVWKARVPDDIQVKYWWNYSAS